MPFLRSSKDGIALHRLSIFAQNLIDPANGLLRQGFQEHRLARIDCNELDLNPLLTRYDGGGKPPYHPAMYALRG